MADGWMMSAFTMQQLEFLYRKLLSPGNVSPAQTNEPSVYQRRRRSDDSVQDAAASRLRQNVRPLTRSPVGVLSARIQHPYLAGVRSHPAAAGRPFGVLAPIRAGHSGRVSSAQVRRLSGGDAGAPPARDRANVDDDSGLIRKAWIQGGRLGSARSVSVAMAVSVLTECVFCEWSTLEGPPVCDRSSIFAVVDVQNSCEWKRPELRPRVLEPCPHVDPTLSPPGDPDSPGDGVPRTCRTPRRS
ncbi:hypothetical protein HPB47_014922 [Ixodes persulcatus]|uniref:Uncharacterized protein n=1 Tax=Ixodes persulcatus TaxID=34615 RepID=A0AC60R0Q4_IXOPE|nr:hypothetical protein HPB47_014922 [Ixodes persulcatus]